MEAGGSDDESDTKEESESSDDEVDHVFETENACRLETLSWCRHWMRALHVKAKSFWCNDKALEYDEYDTLLKEVESQGGKCFTAHEEFKAKMLSVAGNLKIIGLYVTNFGENT